MAFQIGKFGFNNIAIGRRRWTSLRGTCCGWNGRLWIWPSGRRAASLPSLGRSACRRRCASSRVSTSCDGTTSTPATSCCATTCPSSNILPASTSKTSKRSSTLFPYPPPPYLFNKFYYSTYSLVLSLGSILCHSYFYSKRGLY